MASNICKDSPLNIGDLIIYKNKSSTKNKIMYNIYDKNRYTDISGPQLEIRKNSDYEFESKFEELLKCIKSYNNNNYNDITSENTIFLETIVNGGIKGLGKTFFKYIKKTYKKYKYIFLYPSKGLGADNKQTEEDKIKNRQKLINYYESLSFKIVGNIKYARNTGDSLKIENIPVPCFGNFFGDNILHFNQFDDNAPYFLMIAEIENLLTDDVVDIKELEFKEIEEIKEIKEAQRLLKLRELKLKEFNEKFSIQALTRSTTSPMDIKEEEEEEGEPALKRSRSEPEPEPYKYMKKYLKYKQKYLQLKKQLKL